MLLSPSKTVSEFSRLFTGSHDIHSLLQECIKVNTCTFMLRQISFSIFKQLSVHLKMTGTTLPARPSHVMWMIYHGNSLFARLSQDSFKQLMYVLVTVHSCCCIAAFLFINFILIYNIFMLQKSVFYMYKTKCLPLNSVGCLSYSKSSLIFDAGT